MRRIVGMSGIPNASASFQSVSPSFLCLFFFSPTWKRSYECLIISFYTLIYCPNLHTLRTKSDINRDGMGLFMLTSLSPSSSITLNNVCVDHLKDCTEGQFFFSDPIQITLEPQREMRQCEGLHGREKCFLLLVVQTKGEREVEIQI